MDVPEREEPSQQERGARIEPPERDLAQGVDLRSRHGVGDEGGALIGEVPQVFRHRAVPLVLVVQVGPGKRRQGVEVGEVRIEFEGELDGLEPLLEGLAGKAEDERRADREADVLRRPYRPARLLERDPFPDRVQVLLDAAFRPEEDRPAPGFLEGPEQRRVHLVHAGRGEPGEIEPAGLDLLGDPHGPVVIGGKRIVDEFDLPVALAETELDLPHDILHAAVSDPPDSARSLPVYLEAEEAPPVASPGGDHHRDRPPPVCSRGRNVPGRVAQQRAGGERDGVEIGDERPRGILDDAPAVPEDDSLHALQTLPPLEPFHQFDHRPLALAGHHGIEAFASPAQAALLDRDGVRPSGACERVAVEPLEILREPRGPRPPEGRRIDSREGGAPFSDRPQDVRVAHEGPIEELHLVPGLQEA